MRNAWNFTKDLFVHYLEDNALQKGAALAYYTVFSFVPIIILIIAVIGFIFGEKAVQGEIYHELQDILGSDAAIQIEQLIKNRHTKGSDIWATIIGIITLVFGATAVFNQLQSSMNDIWDIKAKPKNNILKYIFSHILSFCMMMCIGFALLITTLLNTLLYKFSELISYYTSEKFIKLSFIFENILSLCSVSFLFALVFKYMADAKVSWRPALVGGVFTALLFSIGKFLISMYVGHSNITTAFGSASVIVILMVWVYYTSQIIFLGAEFTYLWGKNKGYQITPTIDSVKVIHQEVIVEEEE